MGLEDPVVNQDTELTTFRSAKKPLVNETEEVQSGALDAMRADVRAEKKDERFDYEPVRYAVKGAEPTGSEGVEKPEVTVQKRSNGSGMARSVVEEPSGEALNIQPLKKAGGEASVLQVGQSGAGAATRHETIPAYNKNLTAAATGESKVGDARLYTSPTLSSYPKYFGETTSLGSTRPAEVKGGSLATSIQYQEKAPSLEKQFVPNTQVGDSGTTLNKLRPEYNFQTALNGQQGSSQPYELTKAGGSAGNNGGYGLPSQRQDVVVEKSLKPATERVAGGVGSPFNGQSEGGSVQNLGTALKSGRASELQSLGQDGQSRIGTGVQSQLKSGDLVDRAQTTASSKGFTGQPSQFQITQTDGKVQQENRVQQGRQFQPFQQTQPDSKVIQAQPDSKVLQGQPIIKAAQAGALTDQTFTPVQQTQSNRRQELLTNTNGGGSLNSHILRADDSAAISRKSTQAADAGAVQLPQNKRQIADALQVVDPAKVSRAVESFAQPDRLASNILKPQSDGKQFVKPENLISATRQEPAIANIKQDIVPQRGKLEPAISSVKQDIAQPGARVENAAANRAESLVSNLKTASKMDIRADVPANVSRSDSAVSAANTRIQDQIATAKGIRQEFQPGFNPAGQQDLAQADRRVSPLTGKSAQELVAGLHPQDKLAVTSKLDAAVGRVDIAAGKVDIASAKMDFSTGKLDFAPKFDPASKTSFAGRAEFNQKFDPTQKSDRKLSGDLANIIDRKLPVDLTALSDRKIGNPAIKTGADALATPYPIERGTRIGTAHVISGDVKAITEKFSNADIVTGERKLTNAARILTLLANLKDGSANVSRTPGFDRLPANKSLSTADRYVGGEFLLASMIIAAGAARKMPERQQLPSQNQGAQENVGRVSPKVSPITQIADVIAKAFVPNRVAEQSVTSESAKNTFVKNDVVKHDVVKHDVVRQDVIKNDSVRYITGVELAVLLAAGGVSKIRAERPEPQGVPADLVEKINRPIRLDRRLEDVATTTPARQTAQEKYEQTKQAIHSFVEQFVNSRCEEFADKKPVKPQEIIENISAPSGWVHEAAKEAPNSEDVLEEKLERDQSESNGTNPSSTLYRPIWLIAPGETFVSIAEDQFGDGSIAWLIADLNIGKFTETSLEGKRVIEIQSRQPIELPVASDIEVFRHNRKRHQDAENLVTIVTSSQVDLELKQATFRQFMGTLQNNLPLPGLALLPQLDLTGAPAAQPKPLRPSVSFGMSAPQFASIAAAVSLPLIIPHLDIAQNASDLPTVHMQESRAETPKPEETI